MNEIHVVAPPERVFEVLSDPRSYAEWVVGTADVPEGDADWPAEGSALHHEQGVGPLTVGDETEVLESDPPRRLVLLAALEPLGKLRITLELAAEAGGTRVRMTEEAAEGLMKAVENPLSDLLLRGRNVVSLGRLKRLAEAR